jgi:hypothetical protein
MKTSSLLLYPHLENLYKYERYTIIFSYRATNETFSINFSHAFFPFKGHDHVFWQVDDDIFYLQQLRLPLQQLLHKILSALCGGKKRSVLSHGESRMVPKHPKALPPVTPGKMPGYQRQCSIDLSEYDLGGNSLSQHQVFTYLTFETDTL